MTRPRRKRLAKCEFRGPPTLSYDCGCSGIYQLYQCKKLESHCVTVGHDKPKGRIVETGEIACSSDIPVCGDGCSCYEPEKDVL